VATQGFAACADCDEKGPGNFFIDILYNCNYYVFVVTFPRGGGGTRFYKLHRASQIVAPAL